MGQTFKESWDNFISYLKLFLFLIVAGGAGYYFYNKYQQNAAVEEKTAAVETAEAAPTPVVIPETISTEKPSQFVGPVKNESLPILLDDFSEKPVVLPASFTALEKIVEEQRVKLGKLQPAWILAVQFCRQMKVILQDRNAAAERLQKQNAPHDQIVSAIPKSKADEQNEQTKRDFFAKSAAQRWNATVPQRKKAIEQIYQQLLAAEAKAAK